MPGGGCWGHIPALCPVLQSARSLLWRAGQSSLSGQCRDACVMWCLGILWGRNRHKNPLRFVNVFCVVPFPNWYFFVPHTCNDANKEHKLQLSRKVHKTLHSAIMMNSVCAHPPVTLCIIFLFSHTPWISLLSLPAGFALHSTTGAALGCFCSCLSRLLCLSNAPPGPASPGSTRLSRRTELTSSKEQSPNLRWISFHFPCFDQQWPTAVKRFCLHATIRKVRNSPQNLLCRTAGSHSSDSMIHQFIWLTGLIEGLKGSHENQNKIHMCGCPISF